MKSITFNTELVSLILSGGKTATWRVSDHRDLRVGDVLEFLEHGTLHYFMTAVVTEVFEKPFEQLTIEDKVGHESYSSDDEMYKVFSGYYKKEVGPETVVKVARYTLLGPKPGVYRHFKGNEYEVLQSVKHGDTLEKFVLYKPLYGERDLTIRPYSLFTDIVDRDGYHGPRFLWLREV